MSSVPGSEKVIRCTVKPASLSTRSRNASAPPSAGVTDRQRTSSRVRATGSALMRSVTQQFVDARLRARLLVDALDDDGAVEARADIAARHRIAWHRAGDDDRIGRHLAVENLAGGAVDDLGRHANVDAHAEHGALAHDYAFDDFRARADEAIVLDDDRSRLQRLEHAADADAAG